MLFFPFWLLEKRSRRRRSMSDLTRRLYCYEAGSIRREKRKVYVVHKTGFSSHFFFFVSPSSLLDSFIFFSFFSPPPIICLPSGLLDLKIPFRPCHDCVCVYVYVLWKFWVQIGTTTLSISLLSRRLFFFSFLVNRHSFPFLIS